MSSNTHSEVECGVREIEVIQRCSIMSSNTHSEVECGVIFRNNGFSQNKEQRVRLHLTSVALAGVVGSALTRDASTVAVLQSVSCFRVRRQRSIFVCSTAVYQVSGTENQPHFIACLEFGV